MMQCLGNWQPIRRCRSVGHPDKLPEDHCQTATKASFDYLLPQQRQGDGTLQLDDAKVMQ